MTPFSNLKIKTGRNTLPFHSAAAQAVKCVVKKSKASFAALALAQQEQIFLIYDIQCLDVLNHCAQVISLTRCSQEILYSGYYTTGAEHRCGICSLIYIIAALRLLYHIAREIGRRIMYVIRVWQNKTQAIDMEILLCYIFGR